MLNGGKVKMSVKSCENLEKSQVKLTIEVGAEEFEKAVNKAYLQMRGKMNVPGFRPGKAPRKIIEGMYGAEVFYEEAVNIVLPDAYEAAVQEQKLEVVGYPQVELESCGKDGVVFQCTVAVYPEVTLGQYKGLEAPRAEVKVMAADVNARLKEMAERNSRLVSVERAVKKGDTATIDFEGFDNGVAFDGGKGENFDLEIGSGSFVPGFEDQVIGMKAGEEKDIDITFPEDYHADLAGKAVVFKVKVHEVKEKEIPALDDEFAKDVSEFDTLKDLKADLKKKITEERQKDADRVFEENLMNQVAENITADIPDVMVENQAHQYLDNFKAQISRQFPYEEYKKMTGMDDAKLLEEAKEPALRQVKMDLATAAIIKAENIEASDEEVEAEFAKMAEQFGMDVEMVKKYLAGAEVVYGVRSRRDTDTFFKRFTAEGFYHVMNALGADIVFNHADYRLISTRVLESFADYREVNIFLRGMVPLVGYPSDTVYYERHERLAGESHYPLRKMLALAFDGITSLSNKPIRLITGAGIVVSLISFIGVLWAIVQAVRGSVVAGWASTICIVCFMGGVQLVCLGVIGEYVGKIYMETKARPRYIISERTWAPYERKYHG